MGKEIRAWWLCYKSGFITWKDEGVAIDSPKIIFGQQRPFANVSVRSSCILEVLYLVSGESDQKELQGSKKGKAIIAIIGTAGRQRVCMEQ